MPPAVECLSPCPQDRICINQKDPDLKKKSIWSLPGLLKKSDKMLALWDDTWGERALVMRKRLFMLVVVQRLLETSFCLGTRFILGRQMFWMGTST